MDTITQHRSTFAGALAAVVLALALPGCGGEDTAGQPAAADRDPMDGALKFARCMREQGLDFPDPQAGSNGMIKIGPGPGSKGIDPEDPKVEAAHKRCGKHLEKGGGRPPDAATRAKFQDAFLKYAACMRRNGIDMPDPKPGGGLVFRKGDAGAPDLDSPAFAAADKKCHGQLAGVGERVRGEKKP